MRYTRDHEWINDDAPASVGITAVACEQLGDLVYLSLPEVGEIVEAGQAIGEIESTKAVADFLSPVAGTIVEVNTAALDDPTIVSSDPTGAGWLVKIDVTTEGELLTEDEYAELVVE